MALALVQGAMLASLFLSFGTVLFFSAFVPPELAAAELHPRTVVARHAGRMVRAGLGLAVLAGCVWLLMETAVMTEGTVMSSVLGAIPVVLSQTEFGHVQLAQILLMAGAFVAFRGTDHTRRLRLAAGLSGLATLLQAWHLHAAAMYGRPSLLLFCEIFHVMAAAGWLGMLPALLLLVSVAPLNAASRALQRFSPFGALCVFVLVATAFCQGLILVGSIHALLTSAYGWMVLVKLALFAVLIGLAYRNQFRLAPRLLATNPEAGRCALRRSILLESIAGLLIVLAAGVLANLPPGMDMM